MADSRALSDANLQLIDNTINNYMSSFTIPGLSLAISQNGRLVYAKGFGMADIANAERVHPRHRFRVASVSKTLTAAAVLKIRDLSGLSLDDTVFGSGGILANDFGLTTPLEEQFTVRHLLQHTSGYQSLGEGTWLEFGPDPRHAVVKQVVLTDPVWTPGSTYDYLNTGYLILGRIIHQLSGRTYEQFVKDEILAPACVTEMEIGGATSQDRKVNEVLYYDINGRDPYTANMNPSKMDAHGGWIAKPIDLLLFLRRIDLNPINAEILSSDSLTQMIQPSLAPDVDNNGNPTIYGLGIVNSNPQIWHNGGMPGSLANLVCQTNNGMSFAVTCNLNNPNDGSAGILTQQIWSFINPITTANAWPTYDLFPCQVPPGPSPSTMEVAHDVYVDGAANCTSPNGWQTACGTQLGGPRNLVKEGVKQVFAGGRLHIAGGVYQENLVINRRVTVQNYGGSAVIGTP